MKSFCEYVIESVMSGRDISRQELYDIIHREIASIGSYVLKYNNKKIVDIRYDGRDFIIGNKSFRDMNDVAIYLISLLINDFDVRYVYVQKIKGR